MQEVSSVNLMYDIYCIYICRKKDVFHGMVHLDEAVKRERLYFIICSFMRFCRLEGRRLRSLGRNSIKWEGSGGEVY